MPQPQSQQLLQGLQDPSERWVLSLVSDAALPIGSNGLEKSLQTAENEFWAELFPNPLREE